MLHLSGRFLMKHFALRAKYEAQLALHEAALRAMKRSLTASCFLPIRAKKNGRDTEIRTPDLLTPSQTR